MKTVRDVVEAYLLASPCNSVTGDNGRTIQNQGYEDGEGPFWAYDENGEPVGSMPLWEAMTYIGL